MEKENGSHHGIPYIIKNFGHLSALRINWLDPSGGTLIVKYALNKAKVGI